MSKHSMELKNQKPSEFGSGVMVSKDGKTILAGKGLVPDWITVPAQLGGGRSNIKETFKRNDCGCGNSGCTAQVIVLEKPFVLIGCITREAWVWIRKPADMAEFKAKMTA
jgi:hypothetical protein